MNQGHAEVAPSSAARVVQCPGSLRMEQRFPELVDSEAAALILRDFLASDSGQRLMSRIPQRRFGRAADLDRPLLLLASDAGAYFTGSVIAVDGGHLVSTL